MVRELYCFQLIADILLRFDSQAQQNSSISFISNGAGPTRTEVENKEAFKMVKYSFKQNFNQPARRGYTTKCMFTCDFDKLKGYVNYTRVQNADCIMSYISHSFLYSFKLIPLCTCTDVGFHFTYSNKIRGNTHNVSLPNL